MGQTRTQAPETQSAQKQPTPAEDAALVIFAILSGQAVFPNPAEIVAAALLKLTPAFLPAPLRADISAQAARLVLTDPPTPSKGSGALSAANRENLKYRVAYGFAAIKRLTKAVRDARQGDEIGERLDKALKAEKSYLTAHQKASERRLQGARLNEAAATIFKSDILSWNHGPVTETSRPHHVAANGKNYSVSNPPKMTGALPGVLPGCGCSPGPPRPNVEVMK